MSLKEVLPNGGSYSFEGGNNYQEERQRAIECMEQWYWDMYGIDVDLSRCMCHHEKFRSDVDKRHPNKGIPFSPEPWNINQCANLYPFADPDSPEGKELIAQVNAAIKDHKELHFKLGKQAYETIYKRRQERLEKRKSRKHHR